MDRSGLKQEYQKHLALGLLGAIGLHLALILLLYLIPSTDSSGAPRIIRVWSLVELITPPPPPPLVEEAGVGGPGGRLNPVPNTRDRVIALKASYRGEIYGFVYDESAGGAAGSDSMGYVEICTPRHPKIVMSATDRLPVCVLSVLPAYPDSASRNGIEGQVWLQVLVNEVGNVEEVFVFRKSKISAGFEDLVIEAARKWKYHPALADDKPKAVWIVYALKFYRTQKAKVDPPARPDDSPLWTRSEGEARR